MTLHESSSWEGRTVFHVRCACNAWFDSRARIMVGKYGPITVSQQPCPACGKFDTVMEVSTEERK